MSQARITTLFLSFTAIGPSFVIKVRLVGVITSIFVEYFDNIW